MDKATRQMMNDAEQALIRRIESKAFGTLDEEALLDLHARTRRARDKYTKLVRRRGAAKVGKHGSRAVATKATQRTAAKAEVFEDALATVSARLAKVAAGSAKALRDERIAAARSVKQASTKKREKAATKKKDKTKRAATKKLATKNRKAKTPASERARASSRAGNQRRQARRDQR